jgi:hypothetical protein
MNRDKRYNYVYKMRYVTGKYYIGVRSCDCEIHEDKYFGSAFNIPKEVKVTGIKCILSTHETRQEAELEEIRLHKVLNVKDNKDYYNECNANSTKFYPSAEALERASKKRTGRTAQTHEYIKKQAQARKQYRGDTLTEAQIKAYKDPKRSEKLSQVKGKYVGANRTLAQKVSDAKRLNIPQGPNPKKARPGLSNGRSKPWWYITPEGKYTEVLDSVSNYRLNNTFPMSRKSINRYLNGTSNPEAINSKAKGWKFGHLINLDTVTD